MFHVLGDGAWSENRIRDNNRCDHPLTVSRVCVSRAMQGGTQRACSGGCGCGSGMLLHPGSSALSAGCWLIVRAKRATASLHMSRTGDGVPFPTRCV